jgi:hypothetical protein
MIRPATCPICQKPAITDGGAPAASFPFCSERCRQVDLFRWFDGKYAIVETIDPELLDAEAEGSPPSAERRPESD